MYEYDVNLIHLKEIGFSVWSRGICVKMSTKLKPGKINIPVVVGGVHVNPGDMIFADNDSVVVVPGSEVETVYNRTKAREEAEDAKKEGIESKPLPTAFIQNTLRHINVSECVKNPAVRVFTEVCEYE